MSGPLPRNIKLLESERYALKQIIRRQKTEQRIVRRAKIILSADSELNNQEISRALGMGLTMVKTWRKRWYNSKNNFSKDKNKELEFHIIGLLSDEKRSGRPITFTETQMAQIMALACEAPSKSNRPISHWTNKELADEVVKRKIVKGISRSTIGRFLKIRRYQTTQE